MKKKIAIVLSFVLAGALALGGCGAGDVKEDASATAAPDASASPSATDDVVVAEVSGDPIYYSEYSAIMTQMGVSPDDENASYYTDSVIDSLVSEKVLKKMLTDKGYMDLTDEQQAQAEQNAESDMKEYIEYYYKSDIESKLGEGYTDEQYATEVESYKQQVLDSIGQTWDELVDSYKLSVAEDAAKADLLSDIAPTEDEIKAEYDKQVADSKESMDSDPTVYESDVKYGSTIYYAPEGLRNVKQVLFNIDDNTSKAISLLRDNSYDDQADQLLEKALADIKTQADEVLAKLQSGEMTFEDAMAQYQDTSMPETGYAVSQGSGTYDEAFTTGAMALQNIGDISGLISTDEGYHILQYTGDVTPGAVSYDSLKDTITESLKSSLQDEKWSSIMDDWKEQCNVTYYKENY